MASERKRAATLGIVLAAVAAAVVLGAWFVNVWAFDRRVALFDIGESGLVTWSSASATVAAGVIALLLSFVDPAQKVRGPVLAVGLAYISFDDSVAVHERLATKVAHGLVVAEYYIRVIYPIVLFPLLLAVAYLLFDLGRTDPLARRFIVVGGWLGSSSAWASTLRRSCSTSRTSRRDHGCGSSRAESPKAQSWPGGS